MADETESGQDRTEEPSDKRRRDYREKGKVAQSRDFGSVGVLLSVLLALWGWWPYAASRTCGLVREFLSDGTGSPGLFLQDPLELLRLVVGAIVWIAGPPLLAGAAAGLGLAVAQVGLEWTWKPLEPDLSHLDPVAGIRNRLLSAQALFEWLKAMAKVAVIGLIGWKVVVIAWPMLADLAVRPLGAATGLVAGVLARLVGYSLLAMLGLGIVDLIFSKWQLLRRMRMTLQEVKQEHKEMEGDPHLRARIRRVMGELSRNRLVTEVGKATVVVANPSHYAIAIRYEIGQPGPPRVVARGADERARRIKDVARSAGIPRIENRALARALYARCKEGQEIPADLYEGVAEVLAFVYRLRQAHGRGAAPSPALA